MHLEIVEPTLVSEAGHCAALFASLQDAAPNLPYRLWVDRRAQLPAVERQGVPLARYFSRRWRKLQAPWLYRRLLRSGAPILVPTATWFDLRALDLASGGRIGPHRVFLYFHKWRASPSRAAALAALARRQPEVRLFGTSPMIVQALRAAGFAHVAEIPPVLGAASAAQIRPFRALLSAGAARADKGFGQVVDLVELLQQSGADLPIVVQASGDHYGRYDERTRAQLQRLHDCRYPHLTVLTDTLDAQRYQELFAGTVCLQPYEAGAYADKMSAVTYDALRQGAPIVTTAGTTMATLVERSAAGVVVAQPDAPQLLQACRTILAQFARYSQCALRAGEEHAPAAAWRPMVEQLEEALKEPSPPAPLRPGVIDQA